MLLICVNVCSGEYPCTATNHTQ